MAKTPKKLFAEINKSFLKTSGFDIADTHVSTMADVVDRARCHIEWYRDHTESMAQAMESDLYEFEQKHGLIGN